MVKRFISIFVLIPLLVCANIRNQHNTNQALCIQPQNPNLGFENVTGKGVTQQIIDSFIDFANLASIIYGEDVEKSSKFIKFRMDDLYGKNNDDNFYIFIQTDLTISNRYLWVTVDSVYAGLSGINKIYPKWSYLFVRNYGDKSIMKYDFIKKDQIGLIEKNLLDSIKKIILSFETQDSCTCSKQSIQGIGKGLRDYDNNSWSVICDDKGVTSALIFTFYKRYLSIKVRSCYYTMYNSI